MDEILKSLNFCKIVTFEVLIAVSIKVTASWDVAPCSLVYGSPVCEESIASNLRL
jgi:hypothetical protein